MNETKEFLTPDGWVSTKGKAPKPRHVRICRDWFQANKLTKRTTSFELKYAIQDATRTKVSHGAVIKAALSLNYGHERVRYWAWLSPHRKTSSVKSRIAINTQRIRVLEVLLGEKNSQSTP